MLTDLQSVTTLHNGVEMPVLGLGTWKAGDGEEVYNAVRAALDLGYRHIDTAAIYNNETGVGEAIRDAAVPREDIFVTTKLWNDAQRSGKVQEAFDASRDRLGLDHVDLYLIHWAIPGQYLQTWAALEKIHEAGGARAIGLSNFQRQHIEDVFENCSIRPMVNQIELHPRLTQVELTRFCQDHDIVVEAWSPIMRGEVGEIPQLQQIAERHGKTPVQVTLRWQVQRGLVTIPKSVHKDRIASNADIFDFELSEQDMETITALNADQRLGPDPENVPF